MIGEDGISQDYKNLNIVKLDSLLQYNEIDKTDSPDGYYGYLLDYYDFVGHDSLSKIVRYMYKYDTNVGIYTDTINGRQIQYNRAFDLNLLKLQVCNPPLFAKRPIKFDTNLRTLIFYDILLSSYNKTVWYHYPTPLIREKKKNNYYISQDINILQQKYGLDLPN